MSNVNASPLIKNDSDSSHSPESSQKILSEPKWTLKQIIYVSVFAAAVLISLLIIIIAVSIKNVNEMSFIMINDIHVDPKYLPYSIPGNKSFCRNPDMNTSIKHPYGQYICDAPNETFESLCNYLPQAESKPAFMIFGGDSLGHALDPTREGIAGTIQYILDKMTAKYPNIPVLFTIGNNDLIPNYGNFGNDTLDFESLANVFAKYMNEQQIASFKKGGYYYHDIPSQKLRILLLNNIIYHWRHGDYDPSNPDPYGQFAWMKSVTDDAIKQKMKVAIVMHTPVGVAHDDYQVNFRDEYMKSFADTIKPYNYEFILVGHTHKDQFIPVHKDLPKVYTLCAPAVTPAHLNNPGFRVYKLRDGSLYNYIQYFADISSNPQGELKWEIEYDFNSYYGMKDASMDSIYKAVQQLTANISFFWKYREALFSRGGTELSFYKCILTAVTKAESKACVSQLNKIKESLQDERYYL